MQLFNLFGVAVTTFLNMYSLEIYQQLFIYIFIYKVLPFK